MTDSNPRPEEEIADQWSLEDLKKSILDSAADYDRIMKSPEDTDGKGQEETESTSKE